MELRCPAYAVAVAICLYGASVIAQTDLLGSSHSSFSLNHSAFADYLNDSDIDMFDTNDTDLINATLTMVYGRPSTATQVNVTAGVILTSGVSSNAYDYSVLEPAIQVAFARAKHMYNINFEQRNYLYTVVPFADSPDPKLAKTQGCWMWNASGESAKAVKDGVNVVIGPACTQDMMIVNLLTTYMKIPTVTGAANFVDSTSQFPYLTRCGFSTYDMWNFVRMVLDRNNWRHVVIVHDIDDHDTDSQFNSLSNLLINRSKTVTDIRLNATDFDDYDRVPGDLKNASLNARVIVFLLKGALFRYYMIEAYRLNMANGDYIFFALDLFFDSIIKPNSPGHWRQRDGYDREAKKAYSNLFVVSVRDTTHGVQYFAFNQAVNELSSVKASGKKAVVNYYSASFYDAILILARGIRKAVDAGTPITNEDYSARNITINLWNSTFSGASGNVYINPVGDRADDVSIYYMVNDASGNFSVKAGPIFTCICSKWKCPEMRPRPDEYTCTRDATGHFPVVVASYYGYNQTYAEETSIPWRTSDGQIPLDEPLCGYRDDKCPDTTTPIVIAAVIGGLLVLVGLVSGIILFVKARREARASNSVWIADWEEVNQEATRTGSSRQSMGSNMTSSFATNSKSSISSGQNESGVRKHPEKPPPSSGKLAFANWQGRQVMLRICEKHRIHVDKKLLAEVKLVRGMVDDNLLRFLGAILDTDHLAVIGEYCSKGSLQDLLANESFKLDWIFRYALINDIVKGINYIHQSSLMVHGRLSSGCCYVDGKFVLKVGDYGLPSFYEKRPPREMTNEDYSSLYWTAPELLNTAPNGPGTQEGDSYSYAIILQEIILREEPYSMYQLEPKEIVARIKKSDYFRPKVRSTECPTTLLSLMELCWSTNPADRPKFPQIMISLRQVTKGDVEKSNLVDLIIARMEQYTADLEKMVEEKTRAFLEEKKKADALLNQILPPMVADRLKKGETVAPEAFDGATIFFSDIVGFATLSMQSTPIQIVDFLNDLYSLFDNTIPKFDVYKVETIHDSYMVASGLPTRNGLNHSREQASMALALMDLIATFKIRHRPGEKAKLRIGLNSGPVVASVIGLAVPRFGDTVNTASRMESTGEGLRIHLSTSTKLQLDAFATFVVEERGEIEVKGKGKMRTFWLLGQLSV